MARLFSFINDYKLLEKPVLNVLVSEFFIQMVNATFMNILPLYMTRKGCSEEEIALFITFRFLGVFILALPIDNLIKGRKLMSLFYISNLCVPLFILCTKKKDHTTVIYVKLKQMAFWWHKKRYNNSST